MNTYDLQQLKMAWIAAKEAGDTQAQVLLLRDHPDAQAELSNFIAAYHATDVAELDAMSSLQPAQLSMLQRASQIALERVFSTQSQPRTLQELRTQHGLTMVAAAKGLRLGVDVWKKVESGAIELVSLSERQLERFAHFFQVNTAQFSDMLNNSQAAITMNRRQTSGAARNEQQSPRKQSFAEAIQHSTMSKDEKRSWLED